MTVSSVKKGISLILVLVFLLTFFPLSTIAYAEPGGFTVSELQVCVGDVFDASEYVSESDGLVINYSSSDESIVTIDPYTGECHALAEGSAVITATDMANGTYSETTVIVSANGATGSCGDSITYTINSATGVLTLSGTGPMYDYGWDPGGSDWSTTPWMGVRNSIKRVTISNGITAIGDHAFRGFSKLNSISIPDTVTSIGERAFELCESLTSLTLPSGVTSIGDYAFVGSSNLTVSYPYSASIGTGCFEGVLLAEPYGEQEQVSGEIGNITWTIDAGVLTLSGSGRMPNFDGESDAPWYEYKDSIMSVVISDGITTVGEYAFKDYTNIYEVSFSKDITDIGYSSFYGCTMLAEVTFPENLSFIRARSFYDCNALTTLIIPENVSTIASSAFSGCTNITSIRFCGDKPNTIASNAFNGVSAEVKYHHNYVYTEDNYGGTLNYIITCNGETYEAIEDAAIAPTCTEAGLTAGTHCSVCGDILNGCEEIPNLGGEHTIVIDAAIAATCTKDGLTEGSHCSVCNEILLAQEVIPAGHTIVIDEAVAPTCTETGLTEGSHCSVCGEVIIEQTEVPNLGGEHNVVIDAAVAATCTEDGLTEGSHCSVCGKNFESQEIIPAIGHIFDDEWIIDVEPTCATAGSQHNYCSVCEERITESVPVVSHSIIDGTCLMCGKEFQDYGMCGDSVSYAISENELYIYGSGDMYSYSAYETPWYSYIDSIQEIYIAKGITGIGNHAFADCKKVTSIVIPEGVTSIGGQAFFGCSGLTSVSIPDGVTSLGVYSFAYCSSLKSINIPNSVETIRSSAFAYCTSLESVTIPESVKSMGVDVFYDTLLKTAGPLGSNSNYEFGWKSGIPQNAFYGCHSLISVSLPDSITVIGSSAFNGCSSLASISLPDSINSIANYAFKDCGKLKTIIIPNNVTSIGQFAFNECNALSSISLPFAGNTLSGNNGSFGYIFGASNYNNNKDYIPTSLKEVIINGGDISDYSFYGCSNLTSITLQNKVKSIGRYAFRNCVNLESISIQTNLTTIGEGALYNCRGLKRVILPTSLEKIPNHMCGGCSNLESISTPNGVKDIGIAAFRECINLKTVEIPNSVTSISADAFNGCSCLNSILIPNSVTIIGAGAFFNCSSLTSITIPKGITTVDHSTFSHCSSLTSIIIPDSVTSIGSAFINCSSLNSITFLGKQPSIDANAFKGVTATVSYPYKYIYSESDYSGNLTWIRQPYALSDTMVTSITEKAYTGNAVTQDIKITTEREYPDGRQETVVLAEGTDYTTEYINNTDVGVAKVRITNHQNSEDHQEYDFRIVFKDVPMSHSFSKAVYWAVDNEIAKGYTGNRTGLYGVNDTITRGQVVMFLWRAAGRPEPTGSSMTFSDVPTTHSFYKAVQWAYENKITTGYKSGPNAGKFGVNDNCTRGQIVTFMLRYKRLSDPGAGPAGTGQTFNDVPTSHSFYKAIQWAYENKITTGYKDGSGNFGVNDSCTRGQCVTFLYRLIV